MNSGRLAGTPAHFGTKIIGPYRPTGSHAIFTHFFVRNRYIYSNFSEKFIQKNFQVPSARRQIGRQRVPYRRCPLTTVSPQEDGTVVAVI
jgi:hypothetical protein